MVDKVLNSIRMYFETLCTNPEKLAEQNYLSRATSLAELEWRQKEINRGLYGRRYHFYS